jgi:colanic acid/amylovoran biosynthesis protein
MIIELRKGGFQNKGGELMMVAAKEALKEYFPDASFTVASTGLAGIRPLRKVLQNGYKLKFSFYRFGVQWGDVIKIFPRFIRGRLPFVIDADIDAVIDISGFSYSDQWGERTLKELQFSTNRWKRNGTKIILLPQAFGPFNSQSSKDSLRHSSKYIELIYARDKFSYEALNEVGVKSDKLRLTPDITAILPGKFQDEYRLYQNSICIIPNFRMVTKKTEIEANQYIDQLVELISFLETHKFQFHVLLHEWDQETNIEAQTYRKSDIVSDYTLMKYIAQESSVQITPIMLGDPCEIKAVIGSSKLVMSSRFHGVVSSLSQCVPCIVTGWSHKYREILRDYDCLGNLLDVDNTDLLLARMRELLKDDSQENERERLLKQSMLHKKSIREMWVEVAQKLID